MRGNLSLSIYLRLKTSPRSLIRAYGGTSTSRRREPSSGLMIAERLTESIFMVWVVTDQTGARVDKPDFIAWLAAQLNSLPDDLVERFAGRDREASERAGEEIALRTADAMISRYRASRDPRLPKGPHIGRWVKHDAEDEGRPVDEPDGLPS